MADIELLLGARRRETRLQPVHGKTGGHVVEQGLAGWQQARGGTEVAGPADAGNEKALLEFTVGIGVEIQSFDRPAFIERVFTKRDFDMAHQLFTTSPDPTSAWEMHARLREKMMDWIEEHHPQWWPRERVIDVGRGEQQASTAGAAVGDAGG